MSADKNKASDISSNSTFVILSIASQSLKLLCANIDLDITHILLSYCFKPFEKLQHNILKHNILSSISDNLSLFSFQIYPKP